MHKKFWTVTVKGKLDMSDWLHFGDSVMLFKRKKDATAHLQEEVALENIEQNDCEIIQVLVVSPVEKK